MYSKEVTLRMIYKATTGALPSKSKVTSQKEASTSSPLIPPRIISDMCPS